MSARAVAALSLGILALSGSPVLAQPKGFGDPLTSRYGWLFSLEEGKAQARKSGKPLMVVLRCQP
jgi:hypothetical protein